MPPHLATTENGSIRMTHAAATDASAESVLVVDERVFVHLRALAGLPEAEGVLSYGYSRGHETIRLGNCVGLLALPGGATLEILPKIGPVGDPTVGGPTVGGPNDTPTYQPARTALLRMLRHLPDCPFRTLTDAHLGATHLPLWNVFVLAFLDALTALTRQGLQTAYQTVECNGSFVRGRIQPARHLRENLVHAERVAVAYDALTLDVPPNRVLKSALLHVLPRVGSARLETRLYQLLSIMHDVLPASDLPADFARIHALNRLFERYAPALRWAELLLTGRAFGPRSGAVSTFSLLFPMQRVFEEFVAHGFRAFWPTGDVSTQESSAHLVEHHGGLPKFRLRPDILVRQPDRTLVFDTKWKRVDGTNPQRQYGIDSADLYQLFAYGKKYEASDVFLVYPANPTFTKPLDVFGYDLTMRLHVLPFDATRPLREEVERVWQYAQRESFKT